MGFEQAEISGCSHSPGKFCLAFPEILPGLPSLAAMPPQLGFLGILFLPCLVKCAYGCVSGGHPLLKYMERLCQGGSGRVVVVLLQRNVHSWGLSEDNLFMSCRVELKCSCNSTKAGVTIATQKDASFFGNIRGLLPSSDVTHVGGGLGVLGRPCGCLLCLPLTPRLGIGQIRPDHRQLRLQGRTSITGVVDASVETRVGSAAELKPGPLTA